MKKSGLILAEGDDEAGYGTGLTCLPALGPALVLIYVQSDRRTTLCIFSPKTPVSPTPTTGQAGFNEKAYLRTVSVEKAPNWSVGRNPFRSPRKSTWLAVLLPVLFSIFPTHAKP
jgi:hypothetical protein